MTRCLDDNALLAFFGDRANRTKRAEVQQHLDRCARCRTLVAELARVNGRRGDTAPATIASGALLVSRYRLEEVLGEGGTGIVWKATHTATGKGVAIKVLRLRDADAIRRFFREARVTAALRHPHIVEVLEVFMVDEIGAPAMAMELLEGASLLHWVRRKSAQPALSLAAVVTLLRQVAAGLAVAHGVGVVHRDLKPENIFVTGGSRDPRAKLLDFGLAKLTGTQGQFARTASLTRTGAVVGTPHYMAPEQISPGARVDHRADLWSLGVIAYECIGGARPIEGERISDLWRALQKPRIVPLAKLAPQVPKPLAALIHALLSKAPDARPSLAKVDSTLAGLQ